jgi:hypothetical protein
MFTKFWENLEKELAGRWASQTLGSALLFWGGGLLAWVWHSGGDWRQFEGQLARLDVWAVYVALAVGGLFLLGASSTVVGWLQRPMLRLLEGYWPWPFRGLRFRLARWREKGMGEKENRWQALAAIAAEEQTPEQQSEYTRLDAELARYPVDPRRLLPTTLGNLLRSAEEYPQVRYGLGMSVCWPRLWLTIPKEAQETLAQARQKLDSAVRFFTWGILFAVWTVFAWWAILAALAICVAAYWAALQAAGAYGDLARSAFDLYRFELYEQARWPLPPSSTGEETHGEALSEFLFRGTVKGDVQFAHPEKKKD